MKTKYILLTAILCLFIGFFVGKSRKDVIKEVQYIYQEVQSGSFQKEDLTPVETEKPVISNLPTIPVIMWKDSIQYVSMVVDTATIVAEYEQINTYQKSLFNNDYGKLDISLKTQYNKLIDLNYSYAPITQVKTIIKKDIWQPFVSIGYSTNNSISVGGGAFYHKIGLEYNYNKNLFMNDDYHTFKLKYKF